MLIISLHKKQEYMLQLQSVRNQQRLSPVHTIYHKNYMGMDMAGRTGRVCK